MACSGARACLDVCSRVVNCVSLCISSQRFLLENAMDLETEGEEQAHRNYEVYRMFTNLIELRLEGITRTAMPCDCSPKKWDPVCMCCASMCRFVHTCVLTCAHMCIYVNTCVNMCAHVCVCTHVHVCVHTCAHVCAHVCRLMDHNITALVDDLCFCTLEHV